MNRKIKNVHVNVIKLFREEQFSIEYRTHAVMKLSSNEEVLLRLKPTLH